VAEKSRLSGVGLFGRGKTPANWIVSNGIEAATTLMHKTAPITVAGKEVIAEVCPICIGVLAIYPHAVFEAHMRSHQEIAKTKPCGDKPNLSTLEQGSASASRASEESVTLR
jgi:hypothetical protein